MRARPSAALLQAAQLHMHSDLPLVCRLAELLVSCLQQYAHTAGAKSLVCAQGQRQQPQQRLPRGTVSSRRATALS